MNPAYRPDIDGLRAIAVLSVLFYHLGIQAFGGGFVGVDVFFVISGFLITTIIVAEIAAGTFSFSGFYERRCRRILPAVATVTLASLLIGYFLLDADQYESLARSAIANSFFVSNVHFHLSAGYFDAPAELKPLLHTWSLAVEEQYYAVFPILLVVIARTGKAGYLRILAPLLGLSFAASALGMEINSSAVFYMLPTRAWQFLVGSLLSIAVFPGTHKPIVLNVFSAAGASLLLFSILYFDRNTPFPGPSALLPTLGAALLIYSGGCGTSLVSRFLQLRPLVFLGLISYSLYLWHWPLIVYARLLRVVELTTSDRLTLVVLILFLSVLSWRFIERPFRDRSLLQGKRSLFVAAVAITLVTLCCSVGVLVANGFAARQPLFASGIAVDREWQRWLECANPRLHNAVSLNLCGLGKENANPTFVLWGDSHASALASSLHASALRNAAAGVIANRQSCPPLLGIERAGQRECREFNDAIIDFISRQATVDTVFLVGRWALSAKGSRYKRESGDAVALLDTQSQAHGGLSNAELLELGLGRTIRTIQSMGKRVILILPVPEIGYDVPSVLHSTALTGRDANAMIGPTLAEFAARNAEVLEITGRLIKELRLSSINPADHLCDAQRCRVVTEDGTVLYRDDNHLSTAGAKYLSSAFDLSFTPR